MTGELVAEAVDESITPTVWARAGGMALIEPRPRIERSRADVGVQNRFRFAAGDALSPVDRLTLGFLAALAALALARHPQPAAIVCAIATLAAAVVTMALASTTGRFLALAHDFLPVGSIIAIFSLCGPLVALANPNRWDASLAAADAALFGPLANAWRGALGRPWWLTDAASFAYGSYYVVPVALAAALRARGRSRDFEAFVFAVMATFLVSCVGYLLVPAAGPRVPASLEAAVLGGGAASAALRAFLRAVELNQLDAFPSGHTAISLVYSAMGAHWFPRWRVPLAGLAAGILFATVYLSLHYVVDVVAGVLLAAAMPLFIPGLRRLCRRPSYPASAIGVLHRQAARG